MINTAENILFSFLNKLYIRGVRECNIREELKIHTLQETASEIPQNGQTMW